MPSSIFAAAHPPTLATGFADLDSRTGGLQPSSLVLLAGYSSVGKTALGAGIALNAALDGNPVLFISLEQTCLQLMVRMMCSRACVDSRVIRQGRLEGDEMARLRGDGDEIRRAPLFIDDGAYQSMRHISARARCLNRRKGIRLVVIDYLQLVEPEEAKAQRREQMSQVSRRLKGLAKELSVPVLAIAGLTRPIEEKERPRLRHLRKVGSLERDADMVLLMHRPEDESGVVEIDVAKRRYGPTGLVKLLFQSQFTRFENYGGRPACVPGEGIQRATDES
jgi:replicative DNA helicase